MAAKSNTVQIELVYASLTPARQLGVITTVQQGIEATPPRSKANFSSVTLAYEAEQVLVEQAKSGNVSDTSFRHYQSLVEQAGGVLANGIYSTGANSLQSFREHTFRQLEIIPEAAAAAFLDSLNIWIKDQPYDGIDSLLERTFSFFSTVFPSVAGDKYNLGLATYRLIPDLQLRLFETLKLALSSDSHFELQPLTESINAALQAEFSLVERVKLGEVSTDDFTNLSHLIDQAGGELYYQIYSRGQNSISQLGQAVDQALTQALPDAGQLVKSTYQRYLKLRNPSSLDDVFTLSFQFIEPIAASASDGSISSLQPSRQVRVFETIQQLLLATGYARKPYSAVFEISKSLLQTEQNVVNLAQAGEDFTEELINFETLLLQASGVLAIDSTCASPAAIFSFVNDFIKPLRADLSSPLAQAALSAIRARTRSNSLAGTASLIELLSDFLAAVTKSLALVQTPDLIPTATPTGGYAPQPEPARDWSKSVSVTFERAVTPPPVEEVAAEEPPVASSSEQQEPTHDEELQDPELLSKHLGHAEEHAQELAAAPETEAEPVQPEPEAVAEATEQETPPAITAEEEISAPELPIPIGFDGPPPPLPPEPFAGLDPSIAASGEGPDLTLMINNYLATWDDQEGIDKVLSYLEDSKALAVEGGSDQLRTQLGEYRSLINKLVKEGRSNEEIEKELVALIRTE